MKLSKFCVIMEAPSNLYPQAHNMLLIYNTLTKAAHLLSRPQFEGLCNYLDGIEAQDAGLNISDLKEDMIVVDNNTDEDLVFEHLYNQKKFRADDLKLIVAPTTNCNLRCLYCFEENIAKTNMEANVEKQIPVFLKENYLEGIRHATVTLHGGEPLLFPSLTFRIMDSLNSLFMDRHVKYRYNMVTNGTTLSRDNANKLVKRGLEFVQITIDGCKEYHDLRRIDVNGRGTFDKIVKNIQETIDVIPNIAIRISVDKHNHNLDQMKNLIDYLSCTGIKDKLSEIYFSPIVETTDCNKHSSQYAFGFEHASETLNMLSDWLAQQGIRPLDESNYSPCWAHSNNSIIINADGALYKCISLIGRKNYSVGDVFSGLNMNYVHFVNVNRWKACLKEGCPYVPICAGSCHFDSVVQFDSIMRRSCRKTLIEGHWMHILKKGIMETYRTKGMSGAGNINSAKTL
ncbi:MAG: radical SAM protein [Firmicutes bacterium]|nr:radical SAM protein [Dethiobacter sp.]MBS3888305.1 radical SAM protein [Bacillota bacterium]MBS4054294.1 radical SAM protein [Thermaerobacter sp.]